MSGISMTRVVAGLWLSLMGSGCVSMDTALSPEESGWRLPEDARVEQLEAHTAEKDLETSVGKMCSSFRLTADEVRWLSALRKDL